MFAVITHKISSFIWADRGVRPYITKNLVLYKDEVLSWYHLNLYINFIYIHLYIFNADLRIILLLFQIINSKATFNFSYFKKLSASDFFSLLKAVLNLLLFFTVFSLNILSLFSFFVKFFIAIA